MSKQYWRMKFWHLKEPRNHLEKRFMTLKNKAVKGVKWTALATVFNALLNFVQTAILARLLNPEDFGLMGMVLIVVGFGQIFSDMGISSAIIHRQNTTRDQLSSLYWLNVISGIMVCGIINASIPLIALFYQEPRLNDLIHLASLVFLITPFGQQFQILLQKELQFDRLACITILGCLTNTVVSITLAWRGFGVFSLVWGQLANALVIIMALIHTHRNRWRPDCHFAHQDLKGYLSFGLYQMGDKTASYFNVYFIQILLGSMLGARVLGYYTLAFDIVFKPATAITPILTRVAFPVFSKIQGNTQQMQRGYLKILQLLSSVISPLTLGIAAVSPVAIPIIYGEQWIPSVVLIQVLAVAAVVRSLSSPMGALLLGKGKAKWGFNWSVGTMILQLPCLYLGVKLAGVLGGGIAFLCIQIIFSAFAYILFVRRLLGACLMEYLGSMWPAILISTLMTLFIFLINISPLGLRLFPLLIFQILCGALFYCSLMFLSQRRLIVELKDLVWRLK